MKILLTGASGFIGTNFILRFYKNYEIVALVRESSNTKLLESKCTIAIYDGSIESLERVFREHSFDGVIHLATHYIGTHKSSDIKQIIDSNITFGVLVLESMLLNPPKFFINTLTFSSYSNDIIAPFSLYAASKMAFYDMLNYYAREMKCHFSNLLLYDNYGANDTRPKIFNLWQKIAKSGESLEMSGGEQLIDISYIDDVLDGFEILINLLLSSKAGFNQIYTLENKQYSLRELARIFEEVMEVKLNIIWGAREYREREIMQPTSSKINPSLKKLPLWEAKTDIKKGLEILKALSLDYKT